MIYIGVCMMTIFYITRVDLMYENLTGALALPQYRPFILIHIIFCACFFAYKTYSVYQIVPIHQKPYNLAIVLTGLMMIAGAFFPYTMNGQDLLSKLHVYCSMIPCLSFIVLLFLLNRMLSLYEPLIYQKIHTFYDFSLQMLAILIVVFTRVNGYIEILFTLIVSIYLYSLEKSKNSL